METSKAKRIRLCRVEEINDRRLLHQSKGFVLDQDGLSLFVIRKYSQFYAYLNRCPHTGVSLNWQPDVFLDYTEQFIQCSTHAALFQVEDGLCIHGPCVGAKLQALELEQDKDMLYLRLPTQTVD